MEQSGGLLTTFLAVWGALLSTVALTWHVIRDFRDKGALKLDAMIGKMYPDHTDRDYLVINITNVGRRPVLVKGLGAMKNKKAPTPRGLLLAPRGLPKMLKEGKYHLEFTHDFRFLADEIEKIYGWDSTGREWRLPSKELKKLKAEATKIRHRTGVSPSNNSLRTDR